MCHATIVTHKAITITMDDSIEMIQPQPTVAAAPCIFLVCGHQLQEQLEVYRISERGGMPIEGKRESRAVHIFPCTENGRHWEIG